MNVIVKINNLNDLTNIKNADGFILANKRFSYGYDYSFTQKDIINIKKNTNKKIYVLINRIFYDEDIDTLKKYLIFLKRIKVDGIFFNDFGVYMLAKGLKMEHLLIFYHETFLRNSKDVLTYQELGIKNICLSKDMNIKSLNNLNDNKENYYILAFGYIPIYYSKRKVISNYFKKEKLDNNPNELGYILKENTRDNKYRVLEQSSQSIIYADKILSYLDYIDVLNNKIDNFIIDSLFIDNETINDVIDIIKNKADKQLDVDTSSYFLEKDIDLE